MANNYVEALVQRMILERGPLEHDEQAVLDSIRAGAPLSRDVTELSERSATVGERLADRVAVVGGSWSFIVAFSLVLLAWMLLNTDILSLWGLAFDPYPYIFLNLMLSTLAAIQAPIIMMSQNRQAAKDRLAAQLDYRVNLRTELEILRLHQKIDLDVAARVGRIEEKVDALHARWRIGPDPSGEDR